jgi:hypothetical protein
MSYKTQGTPSISQLTDAVISNPQNRDVLQYNSSTVVWDNGTLDLSGQDINLDEIDCRVLRVSETADVEGRLANKGVASFVNDEFIFQNGISNLGDTIYIDNVNTRVGIGISNPDEDLEVDGSIQIDSASVARLKFQQTGMNPHALSEIDGEQDGVNGGDLRFFTKVDTGSLNEKLRINNAGAIGIRGANYGTSGQVLTSGGSGGPVSWTTLGNPYLLTVYGTQLSNLPINTTTDIPFELVDAYGSASASDFDLVSDEWTCPVGKGGLYHFVLQAQSGSSTYDSIEGWQSFIEHAPSGSSTFSQIASQIIFTGTNDDLASICNNISRYYVVNAGDKIKGTVWVRVNAGGGRVDLRNQRTFLQIVKLI